MYALPCAGFAVFLADTVIGPLYWAVKPDVAVFTKDCLNSALDLAHVFVDVGAGIIVAGYCDAKDAKGSPREPLSSSAL